MRLAAWGLRLKYSDEVLRRVREPKRVGALDGEHVGTGEVGTLDEGTVVRIQVRRSGDRIAEARFKVFGCSAAIASASLVAEWLDGAPMDEARAVTSERVVQMLGLPAEREHVAQMAVEAALAAIDDASVGLRA
ncbi:MAG: iron-sulfur cluster assembly scaffold protein [Vicinamibacterales bacterium]